MGKLYCQAEGECALRKQERATKLNLAQKNQWPGGIATQFSVLDFVFADCVRNIQRFGLNQ
jgi:hypothetical protein